jgi:SAM-dependent methyltransferase
LVILPFPLVDESCGFTENKVMGLLSWLLPQRRSMYDRSLLAAAKRIGGERGFCGVIHPKDHLLQYLITHSSLAIANGPELAIREYFDGGARDAAQVRSLMQRLGHGAQDPMLEFAAGYGRVTRHLQNANLVASDIHPDAVFFLQDQLGARSVLSSEHPESFQIGEEFDFIFVLSLFSHLPENLFGPWLATLHSLLRTGGHLMFTTNGLAGASENPLLASSLANGRDFAFLSYTDQPDLDASIYGTMVVTPEYVRREVGKLARSKIVSFEEKAWWNTQDEWVVARSLATS